MLSFLVGVGGVQGSGSGSVLARARQAVRAEPRDAAALRALLFAELGSGEPTSALAIVRRLRAVLEPGLERDALRVLAVRLGGKTTQRLASLWTVAAAERQQGSSDRLRRTLVAIARLGAEPRAVDYALAELHGSPGSKFLPAVARAALSRFLADVPSEPCLRRLRAYLRRPRVTGTELVAESRAWLAKLQRLAPLHPPPFVDAAWLAARVRRLRRAIAAEQKRVPRLRKRLARLDAQLERVGNLLRKDGRSNRQTIRTDRARIERDLARGRTTIGRLQRELAEALDWQSRQHRGTAAAASR